MKITTSKTESIAVNIKLIKRVLFIIALGCIGCLNIQAQSCQANFNFVVDTSGSGEVDFTNTSSGGISYSWSFDDGNYSSAQNPQHTYSYTGNYYVCLTINDSLQSCYNTFCDSLYVYNSNSNCYADFNYSLDSLGGGVSFFDASVGTSTSWVWDFGDSTISNLQDPFHIYNNDGYYYVCLTVSDSIQNCSTTYCESIYLDSTSNCYAYYNYSTDTSGFVFSFTDASTGNPSDWFWDFGDSTTSTLQNPTHTYSNVGNYTVCLTVSDSNLNCSATFCSVVSTDSINSPGNCNASFYIYADSLNPNQYWAVNNSTGNSLNYLWDFGDGDSSTLAYPTHTYAQTGTYIICLTVNNYNSCSSTYCQSISFKTLSSGITFSVISPASVSINEKANSAITNLKNYPNPFSVSTTINYSVSHTTDIRLEVFDMLGIRAAVIEQGVKNAGNHIIEWNAGSLPEGIYFLRMNIAGETLTRKLILAK